MSLFNNLLIGGGKMGQDLTSNDRRRDLSVFQPLMTDEEILLVFSHAQEVKSITK